MAKRKSNFTPIPNTIQEYDRVAHGEPVKVTINQGGQVREKTISAILNVASAISGVKLNIAGPFPRPVRAGETFRQDVLDAHGLKVVYKGGHAVLKLK